MTGQKTWWFLETDDGEWLEDEPHGILTRDPNRALKWPNQTAADDFRRHLRHPWWALKATEHAWITSKPQDWSEFEDEIADAISDSIDMDWTSRDGARAVVRLLNRLAPPPSESNASIPSEASTGNSGLDEIKSSSPQADTAGLVEALKDVRLFIQDSLDMDPHPRAVLGNLMSARDTVDQALANHRAASQGSAE